MNSTVTGGITMNTRTNNKRDGIYSETRNLRTSGIIKVMETTHCDPSFEVGDVLLLSVGQNIFEELHMIGVIEFYQF